MKGIEKIKLHGELKKNLNGASDLYLLLGGAIATIEQLNNFHPSTAHLMDDGRVLRFNEKIGTKEDIEIVKDLNRDNEE